MHPNICRFISDAVYDGRLIFRTHQPNEQRLDVDMMRRHCARADGLRFVPVDMLASRSAAPPRPSGSNKSISALLGKQWIDQNGERKKSIGHEDILVVTPYNMQVNHLQTFFRPARASGRLTSFRGRRRRWF